MNFLKTRSITVKIIAIVLLCWILPLIILLSFNIYFYNNSINSRINDYLERQFSYCNEFAVERINSAVTASRNASYDMTIEDAYRNFKYNKNWSEFYVSADGYFREKYFLNKRFLTSVFFLTDDVDNLVISARNGADDVRYYKENIHSKAVEIAKSLDTDIEFIIQDNNIYLVRNMMRVIGPFERFGVLVLQLDTSHLFGRFLQQSENPTAVTISLGCKDGSFAAFKGNTADELNRQLASTLENVNGEYIDINLQNVVFYQKTKADGYSLGTAMALSKADIYSRYDNLKDIISLMALTMAPLILGVFYFMYTNVTKPIKSLVKLTRKIEKGDFGATIDTISTYNHEFKLLADSFNSMSSELQRLFDTVYKEQLALKDARIMALQSQINPHFLNNTLEMMNWQARMAGDNNVSQMIEALSTLLDSSMNRSERRKIPLSEELRSIDAYLYIISKRFGKRISIEKEIDNSLLSYMVPGLILQPIVENAVIHGIEPVQGGTITIQVFEQEEDVVIKIINNGMVLTDDDLERINTILEEDDILEKKKTTTSLGIRNVNQRIKLMYGESTGLHIFRDGDGKTVTEIKLPEMQK